MERVDYSSLMSIRIKKILLICNNYDRYTLEEDGRIEVQIDQEYRDLNLSNVPTIKRAKSTAAALELLEAGERFDLVITMYNVGELGVFDFSHKFKALCSDTPLVLLFAFAKEIYKTIERSDRNDIDYIFCWNNSPDLIVAIIKLIEDRANAEHDIREFDVQAILLVEDSVRYYSTYLPLLYREVLEQNNESVRDTLNEQQLVMRKRSRPKILMATCYDEALELYRKFPNNFLGIISDIGFVIHRGDPSSSEKADAGIDLCKSIRECDPQMPFLLQSSQESMRSEAQKLGVGFVLKNSKTLTHDLIEYIEREFGFGDFVIVDPDTKEEIVRAKDLYELEKVIPLIPEKLLLGYLNKNYMSKWLFARGLFSLANVIRPRTAREFPDDQAHKKFLTSSLHEYRINQALGVVAKFDPQTYNDAIWFARIGDGSMGGKARGLAFMHHILDKHKLYDQWEGVHVMLPRTLVITTEYFDRFIKENGLGYVINSDISDEDILSEFVSSQLPKELSDALRIFIRCAHRPLAVRSSSKLEDSYYQPFAGVYSTYMIPRTENEDQELRLLQKAIKSVYASVYFASSRGYIVSTGNMIAEEKMGIVIQEICGSQDKGYYFPTLSGVARSLNFYPLGYEKPEEGIAKVAFGLGKAVVDGEQVLRFSPSHPDHVLQTSDPSCALNETQNVMYALNLQPEKFKTSLDDAVNLERMRIGECTGFRNLGYVASTFDYQSGMISTSPFAEGPKIVTFASMLQYGTFPLADILRRILEISQKEMQCCVEVEFAANLDVKPGKSRIFNVLQIRPISSENMSAVIDWNQIDQSKPLVLSDCALGTGMIEDIRDIIYLKSSTFSNLKTLEMAEELREMNARMRTEGRNYVLIGYGRWGSSIPSLGVPVKWSDISEVKVLVESGLKDYYVEPSQGTHFFQNLTSFNVGYVNINPQAGEGQFDCAALDAMPAIEETEHVRHLRLSEPLKICIDGLKNKGIISL